MTISLTTERAPLIKALTLCCGILGRYSVPILNNVRLEALAARDTAERGRLVLTTTDLDVQLRWELPAIVETPGATTMPAKVLLAKLGACDGDRVTIQGDTVSDADSVHKLPYLDAADFPDLAHVAGSADRDVPVSMDFDVATLAKDFERLTPCISSEETRYYLNGVYVHPTFRHADNLLTGVKFAATDGHKLAVVERPTPDCLYHASATAFQHGVIIPKLAIATFLKVAKLYDGECVVKLQRGQVVFVIGNVELRSKLIDGTFPDYSRVMPSSNDRIIYVDADALAKAGRKLAKCASEKTKAFKCSVGGDRLHLTVSSPENGASTVKVEAGWTDGEDLPPTFGVNGVYLTTLLGHHDGEVRLELATPDAPIRITSAGAPELVNVLMPMRV